MLLYEANDEKFLFGDNEIHAYARCALRIYSVMCRVCAYDHVTKIEVNVEKTKITDT